MTSWHALIRTHHITSRKKVAVLKGAAKSLNVSCLLRSGGSPGVMYVQGHEDGVKEWVATVQRLKYKDYQLVTRPARLDEAPVDGNERDNSSTDAKEQAKKLSTYAPSAGSFDEVETVKDFGTEMERRGIWEWWRRGMGFAK